MYEEEKRFSWTNFFIKGIIIIIFILFTVWLLSLSNRGISNKLDVLTDNIFSQNIDKMKEVGKEYFTTERLPKKVGEVKKLSLSEMYEKNYILELKDKNGNACSAKNSYVSIEKMENEYQMKVYLECGEESNYIITTMGCYNYCTFDICEKKETSEETNNTKQLEYEYKKTTGGYWTNYGSWSEWSNVSVSNTDYRQVETKVVSEEYSYDKTITETVFESFIITCPSGYTKTSDGKNCVTTVNETIYEDFTASCPDTYNGGTFVNRTGNTCNYTKTTITNVDPVCPTVTGWNYTGRSGFTCNYSKTTQVPYTYTVTNSKTCYTSQLVYPCSGCAPITQQVAYDCSTTSTKTGYRDQTETTSKTATCPADTTKKDNECVKTTESKLTKTAELSCPTGYTKTSDGTKCYKTKSTTKTADLVLTCPAEYSKTSDNTKCYKDIPSTITVTGTKNVTYYRYRLREYIGGNADYKWSSSNNDSSLINAGYKLTGKTREVVKGGK